MATDEADKEFDWQGALDNLFYGGIGGLMFGIPGLIGGAMVPELFGGQFAWGEEEEVEPSPTPPQFDPSAIRSGLGVTDPALAQQWASELHPDLWNTARMSWNQRETMNKESRQQYGDWEDMMQQAFMHASQTMNKIPGLYARGQGG